MAGLGEGMILFPLLFGQGRVDLSLVEVGGVGPRGEYRQFAQRQRHLDRAAKLRCALHLRCPAHVGRAVEQTQRRARVGVRHDHRRVDAFAAGQFDTLAGHDARHEDAGRNRHTQIAGDIGQDEGDGAHTAAHVAPHAVVAEHASRRVVEVDRRRAGVMRAGVGADDALTQERGLQLLVLEVFLDVLDHGPLQHQVERFGVALEAIFDHLARRVAVEPDVVVGGRAQGGAGAAHGVAHGLPALDIARRETVNLRLAAFVVVPQLDAAAVVEGDEHARCRRRPVEAVVGHAQLVDDGGMEQAAQIGARRDAIAGPRLLDGAGAAQPLARFEHEHLLAGARQVSGAGQPVVAAAHDDGIPAFAGQFLHGRRQPDLAECAAC